MKKIIEVTISNTYEVEIDESKFDDKFISEFSRYIGHIPDAEGHMFNLAELAACGIIEGWSANEFVEGYGPLSEMGIKIRELDYDIESEEQR